ncbi:MAG: DNA mismatch repair protein MutL [Planctomycetota bacterium]|nr:MAG: DNA mismatch repair protein MutL [Planctomycetota bacterium]
MIRALPQAVIDRIAAGEVVDRPSSVIKELIENALDARATRIDVSIDDGGLGLLRVADDGVGIGDDDLGLAFASHATSKLVDVDDLFHIGSFGFRGEALSSIAAVSHARLVTATGNAGEGWEVVCRAGVLSEPRPTAAPRGTTLEIRDLFFNTPARRRFLGAKSTEAARCREVCSTLSLVHPGVRWRVEVDGRVRFQSEGPDDLVARVERVYGAELAENMIPLSGEREGLRVEGLLSLPGAARARPRCQQVFVNERAIQDRQLLSAVHVACKDFLPPSLRASFVLMLHMDPERVDVNVHPTKAEVRFRDREALFGLVRRACRDALLAADLAPRVRAEHIAAPWPSATPAARSELQSGSGDASQQATGGPASFPPASFPSSAASGTPAAHEAAKVHEGTSFVSGIRAARRFIQVLDTYLVHDSPDGFVLIDQHALHERILYARLQNDLAAGRIESQRLLVPETVSLQPLECARAEEMAPELAKMGLEIEPFGPDTLAVRAVPAVLRNESLTELVRALIDPPEVHGGIPNGLDRRLFTMACHAAVKAGDPLGEDQIAALLEQGELLEHDSSCPHGRPTRLVIGRAELEKLFKRDGF